MIFKFVKFLFKLLFKILLKVDDNCESIWLFNCVILINWCVLMRVFDNCFFFILELNCWLGWIFNCFNINVFWLVVVKR